MQQGRITPLLSPWQIFLVFLDFLGTARSLFSLTGKQDWRQPLHFHSDAAADSVAFEGDCVRVIDDSFGYCASYRLERESMEEVSARAREDMAKIKGVYDNRTLAQLFSTPAWSELQYDLMLK